MELHCRSEEESIEMLTQEFLKKIKWADKACGAGFSGKIPDGLYRLVLDRFQYDPDNRIYSIYARGFRDDTPTDSPEFAFVCCISKSA